MIRITLLRSACIVAGAVGIALSCFSAAKAGTLGFDELPGSYFGDDVPDGYGGFDWNLSYVGPNYLLGEQHRQGEGIGW
jgi:hypothetical protein